jgi:hypothetical protein
VLQLKGDKLVENLLQVAHKEVCHVWDRTTYVAYLPIPHKLSNNFLSISFRGTSVSGGDEDLQDFKLTFLCNEYRAASG